MKKSEKKIVFVQYDFMPSERNSTEEEGGKLVSRTGSEQEKQLISKHIHNEKNQIFSFKLHANDQLRMPNSGEKVDSETLRYRISIPCLINSQDVEFWDDKEIWKAFHQNSGGRPKDTWELG